MTDARRRALHDLLDTLPSHVLDSAHAALEKLVEAGRHAAGSAPADPHAVSPEDLSGVEAGRAEIARGDIVSLDEVEDEVLGRG